MIRGWENEWYFLLAAGIFVLLLIYWFRHRGRRFLTGGSFLWDDGASESNLSSRIAIQKLPLSFYLEAGAVLLLACGAAGFFTSARENFPAAVVVLNNSYAMKGESRISGIKAVKEYLGHFPNRRVIWLRCGRDVEVLSRSDSKFGFEKFWDADDAEFDAGKAAAYVRKNFSGSEIVMVTDRIPEHYLPGIWTLLAVGRAGGNLAVSNAHIKGQRVLLEITSFADKDMKALLKVNDRELESFVIRKGERRIFNFNLPVPRKELKFKLVSPGDLLEYDNEVVLLNVPAPPVSYQLGENLTAGERKLVTEVLEGNPDFHPAVREPELLITGFSKKERKTPGHKLFFHRGKSPRFVPQLPLFKENEKLLEGLDSASLKWAFFPGVKMDGKALIYFSYGSLLSLEKLKNLEYAFHFNLSPEFSNVHRLPFWPGFFVNLAEFCRGSRPGPVGVNFRSGDLIVCNTAAAAEKLQWQGPDVRGEVPVSGRKSMLQLKKKGIYTLSDGKENFTVAVNPHVTGVSDLRSCKSGAFYTDLQKLDRNSALKKWSWAFIAAALLLLMGNYYWNSRSRK